MILCHYFSGMLNAIGYVTTDNSFRRIQPYNEYKYNDYNDEKPKIGWFVSVYRSGIHALGCGRRRPGSVLQYSVF